MSNDARINMELLTAENAPTASKEYLEQAKKNLGFVPNMYGYMAHNPALLGSYMAGYDLFRKYSGFNSVEQEVILLSVAVENECSYCVAAHSFVGDKMSNVPTEVTDAIRDGNSVPEAKLKSLSEFTKKMTNKRGWVSKEDIDEFLAAGYEPKHVAGVIAGVGVKTFSNYINHIAGTEVDEAFASRKWKK